MALFNHSIVLSKRHLRYRFRKVLSKANFLNFVLREDIVEIEFSKNDSYLNLNML